MDKSLDDLIKEKAKTGKSKFQGKFKGSSNRNERRTEPYKNQTALVQPTTQNTKINYTGSSTQQKATFSVKSLLPPNQSVKPSTVGVSTAISNYAASAPIVNSGGSIFDRIGNKKSQQSGTSVTISNLGQDVTVADLGELCGSIGEVLSLAFTVTGVKAPKEANVVFARRSEANTFVEKFHNVLVDGIPMHVCLTGDNGRANPFNPIPSNPSATSIGGGRGGPKNIRAGLFGTALGDEDEQDEGEEEVEIDEDGDYDDDVEVDDNGNGPTFSVTLSANSIPTKQFNNNRIDRAGNNVERGYGNFNRDRSNRAQERGGGYSEARGGRGFKGKQVGGRGERGGRREKNETTPDALDDDLDKYMAGR